MLGVVAARLKIEPTQLYGAGHSQIVAPDGTVLAKAPAHGEAVVWADIDLSQASNKQRPDGTDVMSTRRSDLYQAFKAQPLPRQKGPAVTEARVAVFQPTERGPAAIAELIAAFSDIQALEVGLVVLPELCHLEGGRVTNLPQAAKQSRQMIDQLQGVFDLLGCSTTNCCFATTIVEQVDGESFHTAVLISKDGIVLRQRQLHACGRHPWITAYGNEINTADLPWGRVGLVVGNDAIYPETFRLMVMEEIEVAAVCTEILERWEGDLGLLERSAENRINLVVASPRDSVAPGMILATDPDFTLWTEWKRRPFDGNINTPIVTRAPAVAGVTVATVYPAASANRTMSQNTNVVENRPWWLADALLEKE